MEQAPLAFPRGTELFDRISPIFGQPDLRDTTDRADCNADCDRPNGRKAKQY